MKVGKIHTSTISYMNQQSNEDIHCSYFCIYKLVLQAKY